jgi:hypothetical protein
VDRPGLIGPERFRLLDRAAIFVFVTHDKSLKNILPAG